MPPRRRSETLVHTYSTPEGYGTEAAELARDGWAVVNVVESRPRSGLQRIILLGGILSLVFPPKPYFVVTYSRDVLE